MLFISIKSLNQGRRKEMRRTAELLSEKTNRTQKLHLPSEQEEKNEETFFVLSGKKNVQFSREVLSSISSGKREHFFAATLKRTHNRDMNPFFYSLPKLYGKKIHTQPLYNVGYVFV